MLTHVRTFLMTLVLAGLPITAALATPPTDPATVRAEVQAASTAWIDAFNRGDYAACAAAYTADAAMQGRPLADLEGREAIEAFWRDVLSRDPGRLTYQDPQIHVLADTVAVLTARWRMSRLGHGIITQERWEKQDDGTWLLTDDTFEIRGQVEPTQPATE